MSKQTGIRTPTPYSGIVKGIRGENKGKSTSTGITNSQSNGSGSGLEHWASRALIRQGGEEGVVGYLMTTFITEGGEGLAEGWRSVSYTHLTLPTICSV